MTRIPKGEPDSSTPVPTLPPLVAQNRIVLVPGMCTTGPMGTKDSPKLFWEIYRWLIDDIGYAPYQESSIPGNRPESGVYGFSYGAAGAPVTDSDVDVNPEAIYYLADLTIESIGNVHAPRLADFVLRLGEKYPGETFDIIAHSMGGIVSLYAAATNDELRSRLHSIVTINSPVKGNGGVAHGAGSCFLKLRQPW